VEERLLAVTFNIHCGLQGTFNFKIETRSSLHISYSSPGSPMNIVTDYEGSVGIDIK